MNSLSRRSDALFSEDFDITRDAKTMPDKLVGVRVNQIYAQIAKMCGKEEYRKELLHLVNILEESAEKYSGEPIYIPMKVGDIEKCFGKQLKRLPKTTFLEL